jgi:hypothetical protein
MNNHQPKTSARQKCVGSDVAKHILCAVVFALSGCLFWSACVDKIELSAADQPASGMLIQGKFLSGTPGKVTASVFELYTNPNDLPKPIGGAEVALEDGSGHRLELFPAGSNGQYQADVQANNPAFPVQPGMRYRLRVELPGGRLYLSAWETLLPSIPADSLHVMPVVREVPDSEGILRLDSFIQFSISTSLRLPGSDTLARFRWEIDQSYQITDDQENTCYTIRPLLQNSLHIINGTVSGRQYLERHDLLETKLDYRFAEGYYLVVYQQPVSANAYGYFEELNQLLAKKGTLFDPPAGAIRSNIANPDQPDELVYGFFYATMQDTIRLYVSPETAGNTARYCPLPPLNGAGPRPPNACDDCRLEAGDSRYEKPGWWQ